MIPVFARVLWRSVLATALVAGLIGIGGLFYLEQNLPSVQTLKEIQSQVPLRIFSKDHQLIGEFGEKRRIPIKIEAVPQLLIQAIIATEDQRFYEHPGVDLMGLLRAATKVILTGQKSQGGSTITMQVARNFFLSRKKTFLRKINEILLAFKIERVLSKHDILNLYLNRIYFGKRAYGIAAAAEVYYGKAVNELTLGEMAMLAGLPQAPSNINPINAPELAKKRRQHVLGRLLELHYITPQEHATANQEPLNAKYHLPKLDLQASYIAEMARQEAVKKYGEQAYEMGLSVYTSVDSRLQSAANKAFFRALTEYDRRHGFRKITDFLEAYPDMSSQALIETWAQELKERPQVYDLHPGAVIAMEPHQVLVLLSNKQIVKLGLEQIRWYRPRTNHPKEFLSIGAVIYLEPLSHAKPDSGSYRLAQLPKVEGAFVAIQPDSGAILALVGGFINHSTSAFNRATQAERQPGSSFKPFIYSAALDHGFTLSSIVSDAPVVYYDPFSGPWSPRNDKDRFYGPSRLRIMLVKSQNTATVRLLQEIGIQTALQHIGRFGINTKKLPPFLSLALGAGAMSPLELGTAYCVFANGGYRVEPYLVEMIKDLRQNILYQNPTPLLNQPEQNREATRAITAANAFLITSTLQDGIRIGTSTRAKILGRSDLAGKTGTSNDQVDAWYAGFNRSLVAIAWVGFDNPQHSVKEYGSQAALPMWIYFMEQALKDQPHHSLEQPKEVVQLKIDPQTGALSDERNKTAIWEFFAQGKTPNDSLSNPSSVILNREDDSIAPAQLSPESLF